MPFRSIAGAALVVVSSLSAARADWLVLKDGREIRGIDYRPGKKPLFTLETGVVVSINASAVAEVRKSPAGETVDFRGRQVSLREKVLALQAERKARRVAAKKDLELWAAAGGKNERKSTGPQAPAPAGQAARGRFEALAPDEQEIVLADVLSSSGSRSTKLLAAEELSRHGGARTADALVRASVRDGSKDVRRVAFESLQALAEPAMGERFLPYLQSTDLEERVRAAGALETFPTQRAVPTLLFQLQKVWDDFGRAFMFRGEQRSFINDYNLVSGGTGFSIVEVADPEISTVTTGVVLDVKVRRVELNAYVRALRTITSQDLGPEPAAWKRWWRDHSRDVASEAKR
jgi:hypothetical protein